jgi:uridine nucleosidase
VHGNADVARTAKNAARCLLAFGAPKNVRIYPGAAKPLLGFPRHDPEIHGIDGLGGVEGFPEADSPEVQALFAKKADGSFIRALEGMAGSIKETWNNGLGDQVTIVSTGPTTNIGAIISQPNDLGILTYCLFSRKPCSLVSTLIFCRP